VTDNRPIIDRIRNKFINN